MLYLTSAVAEASQFAYWHEVICRHFVPADSRLERRRAFPARFQTTPLGTCQVSRLSAPRHHWSRTDENVRRAPHDEFLISLKLSGETCLGQDGREVRQTSGELALYDTGRPFSYLLDSDIVLLKVPRATLLARLPDARLYTAAAFGLASPVGQLAGRLLHDCLDLDLSNNDAAAERMGVGVIDAVAAAIEWELGGQATTGTEASLLNLVKAYVRANLGSRELDAAHLASRHGVSVRTLNRTFARDGTTAMRWVWAQRLQACREALAGGASARRLTDIAFEHGFADASHFSRAFKGAFGVSPRNLRARCER